jgi:hypothetical protein
VITDRCNKRDWAGFVNKYLSGAENPEIWVPTANLAYEDLRGSSPFQADGSRAIPRNKKLGVEIFSVNSLHNDLSVYSLNKYLKLLSNDTFCHNSKWAHSHGE